MGWVAIIAVYFVVWWTLLFAVLPFGMRTQEEEGEVVFGSSPSAPARPRLVRSAIVTSIVSAIVVFLLWAAIEFLGLSFEGIANLFDLRSS